MSGSLDAHGLIEAGRGAEALPALETSSQEGDGGASHLLAILHARGAWMPKDWPRALKFLALAAEQGSAEAATELRLISPTDDLERLFGAPERRNLCESPRVRQIDGFLTGAVCDFLIERGRGGLAPAATLERGPDGERTRTVSEHRTNSALALGLVEGGVLMALIAERIARALKVPSAVFEAPQLFHYATGQEFRPHIDYIEGAATQRIATFLVYLNDDFEGGETWFPLADLKAKPPRGGAVYFANVDLENQPDPNSLHAGTAPTRGEKWLLSQWIRDKPYTGD